MHSLMLLVVAVAFQQGTGGTDRPGVEEPRARPAPPPATIPTPLPHPSRKEDVVLRWNRAALDLIRLEKTSPPEAARHLALVHLAIYDALAAIYPTHQPYRFEETLREPADPTAAVTLAAHRVLVELYPRQVERLDRILDETLESVPRGRTCQQGVELGADLAEKMLRWRQDDGSRRRVAAYRGKNEIGVWRPTLPRYASGLLPHWISVEPFGLRDRTAFRPEPPPSLTSPEYTRDINEVKRLGGLDSRHRTADQTLIALFWDDGAGTCTPPGHWNLIAREAALTRGNSLPENARLFALLNMALADAAVVCWDCKYHFALWRPITAIRQADTEADPDWQPLLDTPPFPSYTSGHSTFSGAGAAVLAFFFGRDDIRFTVGSDGLPEHRRSYKGFKEAAEEAGRSRIYGGIHYEFDNRAGLACGRKVAEEVCRTRLLPRTDRRPDTTRRQELPSPLTPRVRP
jgi:hypothetical protein